MNFAHRAFAIISDALFPGPLRAAFGIGLVFVAVTTATRLGLAVFAGEFAAPGALLAALGVGLVFDLGVAAFVIAPICLLIAVWPSRRMKGLSVALGVLMAPLSVLFAFTAFAEFTFWNEFSSRFNFIVVDYLVYSREVVGNIRESYNLPVLLCALALASAAVWLAAMQAARRGLFQCEPRYRLRAAATWITLPLVAYFALDARYKEVSGNAVVNELAGNGFALIAFGSNAQETLGSCAAFDFGLPNLVRIAINPHSMNIDRNADPAILAVREVDELFEQRLPKGREILIIIRPDRYAAAACDVTNAADMSGFAERVRGLVKSVA
jgi:hypothetical protein